MSVKGWRILVWLKNRCRTFEHFCHKKSKVFQNIFQNDVRMIRIIDKNIHI